MDKREKKELANIMLFLFFIGMLIVAFNLAACAGRDTSGVAVAEIGESPSNRDRSGSTPARAPDGMRRTFHFAFDSDQVMAAEMPELQRWAKWLAADPKRAVSIEGHTDERGTPEYNIGLGERRALAVVRVLVAGGATEEQMRTVSFGEAKPLQSGRDEGSWAKNRRVEIMN